MVTITNPTPQALPTVLIDGPDELRDMAAFVWESIAESLETWPPELWTEALNVRPQDPSVAEYWNLLLRWQPVAATEQRLPAAERLRALATEVRGLIS